MDAEDGAGAKGSVAVGVVWVLDVSEWEYEPVLAGARVATGASSGELVSFVWGAGCPDETIEGGEWYVCGSGWAAVL